MPASLPVRSLAIVALTIMVDVCAGSCLAFQQPGWRLFQRPSFQQATHRSDGNSGNVRVAQTTTATDRLDSARRDNPAARKISTRMTEFSLPFSVADPEGQYIEAQLWVSYNRGLDWQFYTRQPPSAKEFPFRSKGDGEYWFLVRLLDRDRQLHPAGANLPELKVIVDSIEPELDFRIQTDAAGRIVVRWRAEDKNIAPELTRIAFRPLIAVNDSDNKWLAVPYRPVAPVVDNIFSDQYAWWPEPRSNEVLVQLKVSDLAGNEAIEERQIVLPSISTAPGQMAFATPGTSRNQVDFAGNASGNPAGGDGSGMFAESSSTYSPGPTSQIGGQEQQLSAKPPARSLFPEGDPPDGQFRPAGYGVDVAKPSTTPFAPPQTAGNSPTSPEIDWPSQRQGGSGQRMGLSRQNPVIPVTPGTLGQGVVSAPQNENGPIEPGRDPATLPDATSVFRAGERHTVGASPASTVDQGSGELIRPVSGPQSIAGGSGDDSPNANRSVAEIPYERIRYLNSRRFRLDYQIDALVPGEVSKVVLWMTRDNGQTWTAWAEDTDNQSPFPVEVPEENLYGFRIVFHTVDGLAGRAPLRGDRPDMYIAVDLSHPAARLTAAPYGTGQEAGSLVIQWEASDAMLRNRPVRLSYSVERLGPWKIIEDGLDNTGRYVWKPDSQTPENIYLRLDVTDAAGNVSTSATDQPIDLRGLVPRGRIIDVSPVK